jgi:phytoene dehydrogenase-like protein
MREVDGIIIGAGHNGLILQAYAAMAGLEVVSLERRDSAGGGLQTVEDPRLPGFRHNTHAFFHRAVDRMPWYRDLELQRHGCRYIEPDLNVVLLLRDGRTLEWWRDFDQTAASFARFSRRDADTLRHWRDAFAPILENILSPEAQSPPLPKPQRERLLGASAEGRFLLETSRLSPLEFVLREFEHPVVQAGLLFFNGLREVDLRAPGFGHHIPALLASPAKAQMALGGARSLARALERAVRAHGGEIRTGCAPTRIIVESGRAVGVETGDGETFRARRFVASSLNPQQTFLDLIAPKHLPEAWRAAAANFRYNLLAPLFALNVALSEPPRYTAALANPALDTAFMVILGLEHVDQFADIVRHHEAGTIPATAMWGACPTIFDPSQAPAGAHTAFMWEKLPYRLHGDARNWDAAKQAHGQRMLETWAGFAPNLDGAVVDWFTRSPLDVERSFPNMRQGDLLVGAFAHGQTGYDRPFPGAGHYRAHLEGLYLCGSCCHPGGNITGLPGYNAAQVLLGDLGLSPDWMPEPIERRLAGG